MAKSPHLDKARGCLLGLAIGDALGAPLEGLSAQKIRDHYGCVDHYVDGAKAWRKKPFRWRLPGLYSDDTQQALALADVILERGRVDLGRLAELFLSLLKPKGAYAGAHRAIGRSFRAVLNELERGLDPTLTGQGSAGGGAAMRIAPLAIYWLHDSEALFEAVLTSSLMTHRDIRSIAGAFAVANAVARLLRGEERTPSLLFRIANDVRKAETEIAARFGPSRVQGMDKHLHSMSAAIAGSEAFLELPRSQGLSALIDQANRHGAEPVCRQPTMGFAPALIPTCLHLFFATETFEDALIESVNLGGDADTAGAIIGAIAGAHYGTSAIPSRWTVRLQNREGIDQRAQALAQRSAKGFNIPDFVATERKLSEMENRNRDSLILQMHSPPRGGDLGATRYF